MPGSGPVSGVADAVSADGTPVAAYLALPAGEDPLLIHAAAPPDGGRVLELGCGVGRLTRVLVALGHEVVGVDDNPAMLAHVTGAEAVRADLYDVDLGRRFDVVVAASHLINRPGRPLRRQLLAACARHLVPGGTAVLQRHPPGWLEVTGGTVGRTGPVALTYEPGAWRDGVRSASVIYELAGRRWVQRFDAEDVADDTLRADAEAEGLTWDRQLDDGGAWLALRAGPPG